MISKNKIKLIKSLAQKKYRLQENLFLAEGNKLIMEILNSGFSIRTLICTEQFFDPADSNFSKPQELIVTTQDDIVKCSLLKTPQQALAICEIPDRFFSFESIKDNLTLCLDAVQDPGNLGTILRIADWFGIKSIYVSENTTDVFNPKVIQASMGAFLRVNVYYNNLADIIRHANENNIPTFGTFLTGKNIYSETLPESAVIIMGNEGQGISENLKQLIKYKIHIPAYSTNQGETSESLNVSMATSIICSEFRRGILKDYSK